MKKILDFALMGIALLLIVICFVLAFRQDEEFLRAEAICQKHDGTLIDSSSGFYCHNIKVKK